MDLETLGSWNSGGSIAAVLNFGVGTAPHWVQKSLSAGLRSAPWQKTRRESVRTWGKIWEKMNQIIHEMWCCWWFFVHWNLHKSKLDSAHLFHPYLYHPLFEFQHVGCMALRTFPWSTAAMMRYFHQRQQLPGSKRERRSGGLEGKCWEVQETWEFQEFNVQVVEGEYDIITRCFKNIFVKGLIPF